MSLGYYISVFLHMACACFWVGGMLFLPLVILPGIRNHPDRIAILYKTGLKFRFWGWIALTTLVITGIMNIHFRGLPFSWKFLTENNYGILVGYKILLFAAILLVSGVHDFFVGEKAIEQMQQTNNRNLRIAARWSGRINLLFAFISIFLGIAISRGGF